MISYLLKHHAHLLSALAGHVWILCLVLFFGIIISSLLGFAVCRFRVLRAPVLIALGLLYTVPSLAFFALLIPVLGLGVKNAVTALVCYSLFFILRNFIEGVDGIDPQIIEAGEAMGYSPAELFFNIELPLALPAIIAGVRTASVSTIGIGCVAYAVGAGGIGTVLFEGMRQMSYVKIAWGIVLAIALSVTVNNILLGVENHFARRADPGRGSDSSEV